MASGLPGSGLFAMKQVSVIVNGGQKVCLHAKTFDVFLTSIFVPLRFIR